MRWRKTTGIIIIHSFIFIQEDIVLERARNWSASDASIFLAKYGYQYIWWNCFFPLRCLDWLRLFVNSSNSLLIGSIIRFISCLFVLFVFSLSSSNFFSISLSLSFPSYLHISLSFSLCAFLVSFSSVHSQSVACVSRINHHIFCWQCAWPPSSHNWSFFHSP